MNSDGRRRRAADTAALRLTELMFLMSKLSITTLTCMQCLGHGLKLLGKLRTEKYEIDMTHKSKQALKEYPWNEKYIKLDRPHNSLKGGDYTF